MECAYYFGSLIQWLRDFQVREEITDLLVGQIVEQTFRHQRFLGWDDLFDVIASNRDVLAVDATDDDDSVVLIGQEAVDGASVVADDGDAFKAFADFGAGVHDVQQNSHHVVPFERRQVRPDATSFAEQQVALAARLHVDLLTLERHAPFGLGDWSEAFHLLLHLGSRSPFEFRPMLLEQFGHASLFVKRQLANHVERNRIGFDFASIDHF